MDLNNTKERHSMKERQEKPRATLFECFFNQRDVERGTEKQIRERTAVS